MPDFIDNIELDKENAEFNKAAEFVRQTDKLVYLTGKAGTGKTTFLKYIKKISDKNTVILAPTGVAAINAGGVTINSFFQIPFGPFVPDDVRLRTSAVGTENNETIYTTFRYRDDKRAIIENLELLIIDEISMVRADLLDVIDKILKVFRRKPYLPFGGVQVILIGDTFQLPPIADNDQWRILSQFYQTPFFFSSKVISENLPSYIELKKIYRQNEKDFIDLLNRVRINQLSQNDFNVLNSKYNPTFSANGNDYIILATHNLIVNETNLTKLNQLETELFTFEANQTGIFPDKNKPTDHNLNLKIGAQIMFVKNDSGNQGRYHNGKIGKIKELQEQITVVFDDESEVVVERTVWNNVQYKYNREEKRVEEEIIGTFEQFPIRLAWAITVHKSQGLTFEKVIADLGAAFASGQVYVALSRCTSFNGIVLKTRLTQNAVRTDPRVLEFAQNETPSTLITEQLNTGKADFYYKKSREELRKGNIQFSLNFFKKALKFRNDIETDVFEKYIVTQFKKLFVYKSKVQKTNKIYNDTIEELNELRTKVNSQTQELKDKKEDLKKQNTSIKLLIDQTEKEELKSNELSNANIKLVNTIADNSNQIKKLEQKLERTQMELQSERSQKENLIKEVERQKNLKWYEKLTGKK